MLKCIVNGKDILALGITYKIQPDVLNEIERELHNINF